MNEKNANIKCYIDVVLAVDIKRLPFSFISGWHVLLLQVKTQHPQNSVRGCHGWISRKPLSCYSA